LLLHQLTHDRLRTTPDLGRPLEDRASCIFRIISATESGSNPPTIPA
jgi:hypothetical protein